MFRKKLEIENIKLEKLSLTRQKFGATVCFPESLKDTHFKGNYFLSWKTEECDRFDYSHKKFNDEMPSY